jgi:hypothetical protein
MTIAKKIRAAIERLPKGYVFTFSEFLELGEDRSEAIIKALNRMVDTDELNKLSRGRYYKPESSPFGVLAPSQQEVVKDILGEQSSPSGYLTGLSIYSQLGLTTQVSNTIQIGKNDIRPSMTRGKYKIKFIRQKNNITKKNIPLLQILDSIKNIRKIPDSTIVESCKRIGSILSTLNKQDIDLLCNLSLVYPPSTRALLGSLLEEQEITFDAMKLKRTLNPISKYKLPDVTKILLTAPNWNLV